jgi:hypothetical protein
LIEVPHSPDLDPPELTVEAWIRIEQFPSGWDPRRWAVCKAANEWADANYSLFINQKNVGAYLNIGGGQENCHEAVSKEDPLRLNVWLPIALTYDGDTLRTYCDGREVAATRLGRPRTLGTSPLTLGARLDRYSYFEGDLDEVRIYRRALSPEELRRNVEAARSAPAGQEPAVIQDGLAGYWGFEDVTAQQDVVDRIIAAAGLEPAYRNLLPKPGP